MSRPLAEFLFSLLLTCTIMSPKAPKSAYSRVGGYFVSNKLKGGDLIKGDGLIEPLRQCFQPFWWSGAPSMHSSGLRNP